MFHDYDLRPMLLSEQSKIFQNDNYLYEIKFDGIRAILFVSNKKLVALSRNGNYFSSKYPELKKKKKIVGDHEVIFDGEIIATDNGLPSFLLLQKRNRVKKVSKKLVLEIPVCFVAFDILYDNKDLTNIPLLKRKEILEKYEDTNCFIKSKVYDNGISLFKMVKKIGLEGVVAKKKNSLYLIGERTDDWVKIKNIKVDNFIVHAYQEKTNTYTLFLGEYKNKELKCVGKVSVNKKREIVKELKKLKKVKNQFVNLVEEAIYIDPIKTVRVHYLEKTAAGMLRHAKLE